jgi:DNA-binding LacI/PurR family transcriptional regulator
MALPKVSPIPVASKITAVLDRLANVPKDFDWRETIPALEFYETATRMVRYLADIKDLRDAAQHCFIDLIKDESLSAVVAAQDYVGVLLHAFLKQQDIAVPGRISLCGFDNAIMAMVDDLTTYNFLFGNIAADVIAYIINPAAPAFAGRRVIECSGIIMQRSTTGPVGKR